MSSTLAIHGMSRGPLTGLIETDGHAGYALAESGTWAIEAGPVADARFRRAALDLLEQALVGFNRVTADKLLAEERVQVVVGVSQGAAERFVARLGPQGTGAKAVPTAALAKASPWRGGLPFLGVAAGVVLGLLLVPLWVGLLIGAGAGGAAYMMGQSRSVPLLGSPPEPPPLSQGTAAAIAAIRDSRSQVVRRLGGVLLRLIDQLLDGGDLLALAAGGLDGTLGNSALAGLSELGRLARSGAGDAALASADEAAAAFSSALPSLSASLRAAPSQAAKYVADAEGQLNTVVQALAAAR